MCTLILFHRVLGTHPLLLLMNRDERYGRPSAPPAVLPGQTIVAPRDLRAGGTWIGVNSMGLVIALSNRQGTTDDPTRRSRGLLVLDLLSSPDPARAATQAEAELAARDYNAFNIVMADGRDALYLRWGGPGSSLGTRTMGRGIHALANGDLDDPSDARVARALALAGRHAPLDVAEAHRGLTHLAGDHGVGAEGLCRHGKEAGTVSSTFIALAPGSLPESRLLYAPGPPGETPFQDCSQLLTQLGLAAGGRRTRRHSRP